MIRFTIRRRLRAALPGLVALLALIVPPGGAAAQTIDTPARHAIMIDLTTDTVVFEKDATVPFPPASMSKLMTVYVIFQRLKAGRLSLDDKFLVSRKAWKKGGSKMFVLVNSRVSVHDLLRGIIVQSGNDACIVAAEGLAGSEEAFAGVMNETAKKIGLLHSHFENATGWPAKGHVMSAHDIAMLAVRLIRDFPEYYSIFGETEFTYGGIRQHNRNPLLGAVRGADGLKTGHTEASGYGLVGSAVRNGRRLVLVVSGLGSSRARASESARLMEWGFRETESYKLLGKGEAVGAADVWLGTEKTVPLVLENDLRLTMSHKARDAMTVRLSYRNPVPAPIAKGTPLAHLTVKRPGTPPLTLPLVAGRSVEQLSVFGRLGAALQYLLWGPAGAS